MSQNFCLKNIPEVLTLSFEIWKLRSFFWTMSKLNWCPKYCYCVKSMLRLGLSFLRIDFEVKLRSVSLCKSDLISEVNYSVLRGPILKWTTHVVPWFSQL